MLGNLKARLLLLRTLQCSQILLKDPVVLKGLPISFADDLTAPGLYSRTRANESHCQPGWFVFARCEIMC